MLLLHLDGVGRAQLEHALEHGYAPTLRAMLERGPYRLSPCRSGAPTSTPAFQAGLLYGVGHDIPGYTWFDKRRGSEVRMDRGEDARLLEEELARSGNPLLRGGSVYCSIFSGGALSRRWALSGWNEELCAEDFGMEELSRAPLLPQARDVAAAAMVHSATAGRIASALGLDVASGVVETARWVRHVGSLQHEPKFLFHRVLTECLFAEFAANSCVIDIARGIPIVYACFIGYDEYAHRRGPFSRMALLKLWELDRMLGRIFAAAARARWLRRVSAARPGALGKATLAWARHVAKGLDAAHPTRADGPLLVVPAGDIAHVYSTCVVSPLRESEIRARHPGLLERCARSPAVGFTLLRGDKGPLALRGDRRLDLDRAQDALAMAHEVGHPLAAVYARDLLAMRSAGDVVLLGTAAPCGGTVAFPFGFGSRGGLAPGQLDAFMIHPQELGEGAFASVVRPQDLHRFFLERSGRLSR